MVQEVIFRFW